MHLDHRQQLDFQGCLVEPRRPEKQSQHYWVWRYIVLSHASFSRVAAS